MLDHFRKLSGSFASKLLLSLLVLSFAVWGIGDMVRQPEHAVEVATVGDTVIPLGNYRQELRREMETVRRALGDRYSPELIKSLGLERYVIRSLIEQALLKAESEALGIVPSDADVARRIRSNPAFQDTKGVFDKRAFETSLSHMGISEKTYAERIRQEIASQLILDTLTAHAPVPDIAVSMLHAAREAPRQVTIYTLGPAQPEKVPPPAAGALESYYAEQAQAFNAPESRTVSYVVLTPADTHSKIDISEEALLAAYKERIDEFKQPERRTIDQLLYADAVEATKAHALLQGGKSFEHVARTTPILNKNATSLGKVEKSAVPEAAAEAFSLEAGQMTAPVQSGFGWHVFFVRAVEPAGTAPLNEVRDMLEKDLRQRAAEEAQMKLSNQLEDTLAGGGTLEEAAKGLGLSLRTVGPFTREGKAPDGTAVKLPELDKFLETSFATEEKTESPLMHAKNASYYLLRVDKVAPERSRALDEVRGLALQAWRKEEAEKSLSRQAQEAATALADKAKRRDAASRYALKTAYSGAIRRSEDKAGSLALPPALTAEIFSLPAGGSTAPHPLPSGEYMMAVAGERMSAASPDRAALESTHQELAQDMRSELVTQYLMWLERKYPVEINESLLQAAEE